MRPTVKVEEEHEKIYKWRKDEDWLDGKREKGKSEKENQETTRKKKSDKEEKWRTKQEF